MEKAGKSHVQFTDQEINIKRTKKRGSNAFFDPLLMFLFGNKFGLEGV